MPRRAAPAGALPEASLPRTWPWWVFRALATGAATALAGQAVFAGQFLSGAYGSLLTHRENATYAGVATLLEGCGAVLLHRAGGGPRWPIAACGALFALIAGQIYLGFARVITIHVPLGTALIAGSVVLAGWAWRHGPDRATVEEVGA